MSVVGTQDLAERLMDLAGSKTLASASAVLPLAVRSSLLAHPELEHFHLPVPSGAVVISLLQPLGHLASEDVAHIAGWKFQPLSNATVWLRRGVSASPYLGDALLDTQAGAQTILGGA